MAGFADLERPARQLSAPVAFVCTWLLPMAAPRPDQRRCRLCPGSCSMASARARISARAGCTWLLLDGQRRAWISAGAGGTWFAARWPAPRPDQRRCRWYLVAADGDRRARISAGAGCSWFAARWPAPRRISAGAGCSWLLPMAAPRPDQRRCQC